MGERDGERERDRQRDPEGEIETEGRKRERQHVMLSTCRETERAVLHTELYKVRERQ